MLTGIRQVLDAVREMVMHENVESYRKLLRRETSLQLLKEALLLRQKHRHIYTFKAVHVKEN